jgi:predicted RNase H-like nuclease
MKSPTLYGIDGCPAGWLVVSLVTGGSELPSAKIFENLSDLNSKLKRGDIVAIDMPIGLPADSKESNNRRICDQEARDALGARRNSVFYTPSRGILAHTGSHKSASRWHKRTTGRGISIQCFHILKKIRELDTWLQDQKPACRVYEVHPELSFAHWNKETEKPGVLLDKKASPSGRAARSDLISNKWEVSFDETAEILGPKSCTINGHRQRRWASDDLFDAFAALWTAERIMNGRSICIPTGKAQIDAAGRKMEIHA